MKLAIYAVVLFAYCVVLMTRQRRTLAVVTFFLGSTAGLAGTIISVHDSIGVRHIGIAAATPALTLAAVSLLFGLFVLGLGNVLSKIPLSYYFLIILIFALAAFEWQNSLEIEAGIVHLATAFVAWGVGASVFNNEPVITERNLAFLLCAIICFQLLVSLLQIVGFVDVGTLNTSEGALTRINGTTGHPGTLGKILVILMIMILPLTRSDDRIARRYALFSSLLVVLLIGLSYSRANIVAIVSMILIWVALGNSNKIAHKLTVPLGLAVVVYPFIDSLVVRFSDDPEGGLRPQLLEAAYYQISEEFWFGIGPNSYVSTVGAYDPTTASGFPVHNALLLALAEIGMVGLVLLILPFVKAVVTAFYSRIRFPKSSNYSHAIISATPAVVLLCITGWGMLQQQVLVLLFFVFGFTSSALRGTNIDNLLRLERKSNSQ